MTKRLDVLVIESFPGAAVSAVYALESAGHRIHRCYDGKPGFPCKGVLGPDLCPLARHVDVALLVRARVAPRASAIEQGVACAIRAGVPLVEQGPAALDPYEPFLAARVNDDPVAACEAVHDAALDELCRDILRLAGPVLTSAGVLAGQAICRIEPQATTLRVTFELPVTVTPSVKQALAVRVLDAVRGAGRTYGPVQVSVHDRHNDA